jgi:hypothetical protein
VAKPSRTLIQRLNVAVLTGLFLVGGLLLQGWFSEINGKLADQERISAGLQRQLQFLIVEQEQTEADHQRELSLLRDWIDKVAIPRETILRTARLDAVEGREADLDQCFADATLEEDGWTVSCGISSGTDSLLKSIHYVIDPVSGRIVSKNAVGKLEFPR